MTKSSDSKSGHSTVDLEKIRKRANEIWKRKCQALNTALDDWLQAEREFKEKVGGGARPSSDYTAEEVSKIKARAQGIRKEKIDSLRTAFDDWIEAEKELKEELGKKVDTKLLFDQWFGRVSSKVAELLDKDSTVPASTFNDIMSREYVDLMMECMN